MKHEWTLPEGCPEGWWLVPLTYKPSETSEEFKGFKLMPRDLDALKKLEVDGLGWLTSSNSPTVAIQALYRRKHDEWQKGTFTSEQMLAEQVRTWKGVRATPTRTVQIVEKKMYLVPDGKGGFFETDDQNLALEAMKQMLSA